LIAFPGNFASQLASQKANSAVIECQPKRDQWSRRQRRRDHIEDLLIKTDSLFAMPEEGTPLHEKTSKIGMSEIKDLRAWSQSY
jgi:hypothetical protein